MSASVRSLLIPWIVLPLLPRRPFSVSIGRSSSRLPCILMPRIVIILVLRRSWSATLPCIWTAIALVVLLIVLLVIATIVRSLRILVVLLLIVIPMSILSWRLSLRLAIVRSSRSFICGVRVVCHSGHVVEGHVPLLCERSSAHRRRLTVGSSPEDLLHNAGVWRTQSSANTEAESSRGRQRRGDRLFLGIECAPVSS